MSTLAFPPFSKISVRQAGDFICINDTLHPEALSDSEINDIKAMHRLFQVFRKCDGELFEYQDSNGNMKIGISFNKLALMEEWYERYEEYQKQIKLCDEIKDVKTRANSLLEIENEFQSWMDNLL